MSVKLNLGPLQSLINALDSQKQPMAAVGILGSSTAREGSVTNATIGVKHEYGEDGMPVRSFLRVPLADHLQAALEKAGYFDEQAIKNLMETGDLTEWVKKLGAVGEDVVIEAFETGGYGVWPKSNYALKTNPQTLVETGQLMESITSEVR